MLPNMPKHHGYSEEILYSLDDLQKAYPHQVDLSGDCILFFKQEYDYWLAFAMMEYVSSDGEVTLYRTIFYGDGPASLTDPALQLRELRHMYFGESGYVYYMPGAELIKAIQELSKYFDLEEY